MRAGVNRVFDQGIGFRGDEKLGADVFVGRFDPAGQVDVVADGGDTEHTSWRRTQGRTGSGGGYATIWEDLDWLAAYTRLPLVVKGIMVGEDGRLAADHGARGVIVSNHGARYLDTTLATIEVLPEVVEAVAGTAELIGWPVFWGLAVAGEAGVRAVSVGAAARRVGRHDGYVWRCFPMPPRFAKWPPPTKATGGKGTARVVSKLAPWVACQGGCSGLAQGRIVPVRRGPRSLSAYSAYPNWLAGAVKP